MTHNRPVAIIAGREMRNVLRAKALVATLIFLIIMAVAGPFIAQAVMHRGLGTKTIAVVGTETPAWSSTATALGSKAGMTLHFRTYPTEQAATEALSHNKVELVLVATSPSQPLSYEGITTNSPDAMLVPLLRSALQQAAVGEALAKAGVNPQTLAQASSQATITTRTLKGSEESLPLSIALMTISIVLIMLSVWIFGGVVASSVAEEKSSRVVEMILGMVKARQLLWGKLLGVGAIALVFMAATMGLGAVALKTSGLLAIATGSPLSMLLIAFISMVLAFFLFTSLYAAAGSMVSRMEDLQAAIAPVMTVTMVMYFVPFIAMGFPNAQWVRVLSWIPPFSLTLLPQQMAFGQIDTTHIVVALVLNAILMVAVVQLAAYIYKRSILTMGSRISWKKALTRTQA